MYTITLNVYLTLNYLCIKVYCFDLIFNMILLTYYVITIEVNLQNTETPKKRKINFKKYNFGVNRQ